MYTCVSICRILSTLTQLYTLEFKNSISVYKYSLCSFTKWCYVCPLLVSLQYIYPRGYRSCPCMSNMVFLWNVTCTFQTYVYVYDINFHHLWYNLNVTVIVSQWVSISKTHRFPYNQFLKSQNLWEFVLCKLYIIKTMGKI